MNKPDFQKQEAKQSLWDMDGTHVSKRYRNKGKGRGKDRRHIQEVLKELQGEASVEIELQRDAEIDEAWYCHVAGPCLMCR